MTNAVQPLDVSQIRHNGWTDDLKHDEFVAVDGTGQPIAKANSRDAAELAAPHHSGIFSAAEINKHKNKAEQPIDDSAARPVGAEVTTLPSENSFEKILAHVEKTRDSEAVHERQLDDAEKTIAATEAAKPKLQKQAEQQAEHNKHVTSPVTKTPDGKIEKNDKPRSAPARAHKAPAKKAAAKNGK